ncbi:MAG: DUF2029 domain-containing protein [Deltaproteobacteria bacterium]|nr:DUF2029 domain-containing protein [Deltaproteobacteria bacterium]
MNVRTDREPAVRGAGRRVVLAATLGAVLFLASFGLLHSRPFARGQIIDTPLYQRYGEAMLDGQVPYRDFTLEYPPGALPAFVLPAFASHGHYRTAFEIFGVLLGLGTIALVALSLHRLRASATWLLVGCAIIGLAPLALGSVVLTRFDAWPAFLTAAGLAAALSRRERLGLGLLGLAAAAKIYPIVLVPLVVLCVRRRAGLRRAVEGLAAFAAVVLLCLLPFAVAAPEGLWAALSRQLGRPLQIESLGSSLLLAAHQLGAYLPAVVNSHGSQNLSGSLPDGLAAVQTVLQIASIAGFWLLYALGRRGPQELAAASAGSVSAFIALGKVLSPQFLLWLVPLVPLVGGALGIAASAILAAALVLTHLWFPQLYASLVGLGATPAWLLLARNALLVALTAVLAAESWRLMSLGRKPA